MVVGLVMMCIKSWAIKKQHAQKMSVDGIRILGWTLSATRKDQLKK